MAKGNMFLGMARGKVGDVVFYRADGQQLSRVRNRNPRNPRSNSQLYQRAIMATVVQAYTVGKEIFDHSFQGYSKGAQNQRQFLKLNAKLLRDVIAADINTSISTNSQKGRVVAPGVSVPTPFSYVISKGTYPQNLLISQNAGEWNLPDASEGETIGAYMQRVNVIPGDIYTFVILAPRKAVVFQSNLWDDVLASQNYCDFGFIRLIAKDVSTSTEALTKIGQLFEIEVSNNFLLPAVDIANMAIDGNLSIATLLADDSEYTGTGAIGLIRSRRDQDVRSDSEMVVLYGSTADNMFGIASDYLLDAWKGGTSSIGDSDLILEGGGM